MKSEFKLNMKWESVILIYENVNFVPDLREYKLDIGYETQIYCYFRNLFRSSYDEGFYHFDVLKCLMTIQASNYIMEFVLMYFKSL